MVEKENHCCPPGGACVTPDTILHTKELSVLAGDRALLRNVNFNLQRHEVLAIIGPSGARSEEHTSELQSR